MSVEGDQLRALTGTVHTFDGMLGAIANAFDGVDPNGANGDDDDDTELDGAEEEPMQASAPAQRRGRPSGRRKKARR